MADSRSRQKMYKKSLDHHDTPDNTEAKVMAEGPRSQLEEAPTGQRWDNPSLIKYIEFHHNNKENVLSGPLLRMTGNHFSKTG